MDPGSREKWMPMVARVPGGRGGIRPSLLPGTPLSTEPQRPQFPGAPRSPHGSQAHRPWLCHPLRAHAPPLLGTGRTVIPCPQTLPALGTCASLARGLAVALSGIQSKRPLAGGSRLWRSSPLTLLGPPTPAAESQRLAVDTAPPPQFPCTRSHVCSISHCHECHMGWDLLHPYS